MELYQLEYFRVLCKHGSYTNASQELMVTQPAISKAIKKLEEEYGELINHQSKTFALTSLGNVLLNGAVTIHNEIVILNLAMNTNSQKQQEIIRIGLTLPLCPDLIDSLVHHFISQHTDTSLNFFQKGPVEIAEGLINKTIDIGIVTKDMLNPMLESKDYKKLEYWACFSHEHKFNYCESITPEMLKDEDLILPIKISSLSKGIHNYLLSNSIEPNCLLYDILPGDTPQLARQGIGIAFSPKHICMLNSAPLQPPLNIDLVVAWRKGVKLTYQEQELISFITEPN